MKLKPGVDVSIVVATVVGRAEIVNLKNPHPAFDAWLHFLIIRINWKQPI